MFAEYNSYFFFKFNAFIISSHLVIARTLNVLVKNRFNDSYIFNFMYILFLGYQEIDR